jgi:hypothetical protein
MPVPHVYDNELIPWKVRPEHRNNYHLAMLRVAARLRVSVPLREADLRRYTAWRQEVAELNAVVEYRPDTPTGFHLVPRLAGDGDLVRPPA